MTSCVPPHEQAYLFPLHGTRMLELGNKKNDKGIYKHYFESMGIDHTSIDWNGEDGALKLDLTEPLDLKPFDMITNFGTTEHVHDQYAVWENIHNLLKVNGILVSTTPLPGDWEHHGDFYPMIEFFENLDGYVIEKMGIERREPKRLICVRLKKKEHKPFKLPEYIYKNDRSRATRRSNP